MARIDIGKLTQEETIELLKECINALPDGAVTKALCESWDQAQRDEAVAWLEDPEADLSALEG